MGLMIPMRCCRRGARDDRSVALLPVSKSRTVVTGVVAMVCLLAPVQHVWAEMSGDDYRSGKALGTPAERERAAMELEAERRREAEIAARREADERAGMEREAAAWARLSLGERLLRSRCTACHTLAVAESPRLGRIGWRLTVERMRWWHGAALGAGEAALISGHLHRTYPASTLRERGEVALAAVAGLAVLGLAFVWRRRRGESR
ncbi:MAG: hypothetical protein Q8N44_20905 [Rubrivivax sp.]|nr:hypothetical protein [Rubrivivax sp.]